MAEQGEEIIIDVKVNTDEVSKKLSDAVQAVANYRREAAALRKEIAAGTDVDGKKAAALAEVLAEIEKNSRAVKSNTAILQAATQGSVSNTMSLDEQRQALNTLQKAYASLEGEAKKAADAEGGLRERIQALSDSVKEQEAAIGDSRRNVGNYAQSIQSAFGSIAGAGELMSPAIGLLRGMGANGKSAAAALDSLQKVMQLVGKAGKVVTASTQAQTVATQGQTVAQEGLNVAMSANPIGLIIAGISTLLPLIQSFTDGTADAEAAQRRFNAELERQKRLIADAERSLSVQTRIAQVQGATEEQLLEMRRKAAADAVRLAEESEAVAFEAFKNAKKSEREEARKHYEETQQITRDAYKEQQRLNDEALVLTAKREAEEAAAANKLAEERKKKAQDAAIAEADYNYQLQQALQMLDELSHRVAEVKVPALIEPEEEEEYLQPLNAYQQAIAEAMKQGLTFADAQRYVAATTAAEWASAAGVIAGGFADAFGGISDLLGEFGEQSSEAATASKVFGMAGVLASEAQTIADGVRGVAAAVAAGAGVPFPANLAAIATGVSAVTSTIAGVVAGITQAKRLLADTPKFAAGGVVPGSSYAGDNMLVRANSGEMFLTRKQQAQLLEIANNPAGAANYEALAAAMAQAVAAMPAPVMVYSEFEDFRRQTATIDEFVTI